MLTLSKEKTKNYTVALVGNPNVGKSTIFNTLTGMNQHTGNWSGKTVEFAKGYYKYDNNHYEVVDLPGTYSLSHNSPEERITEEYIKNNHSDCIVVVVDATKLERNLLLAIEVLEKTSNVVICLNLWEDAKKNNTKIDIDELNLQLGVPIIKTTAHKKRGMSKLLNAIENICTGKTKTYRINSLFDNNTITDNKKRVLNINNKAKEVCKKVIYSNGYSYTEIDNKLDRIFTSKITGIPIMIGFFALIFWITAFGANIPSELISKFLFSLKGILQDFAYDIKMNDIIVSILLDGLFTTTAWVVSVMLPPALIFFPLFAIIEDSGYLPRVVFNLDRMFQRFGVSGKLAISMVLGFGCNACGVSGCRIMSNKKERLSGILTNSFIPCNGRIPLLIAIISMFFGVTNNPLINSLITTGILLILLTISIFFTLIVSLFITKRNINSNFAFILELPSYRKPQFFKTSILSIKEKVLYVLSRAALLSIPAGAILWILGNVSISGTSLLMSFTNFFDPFGKLMGVDGTITSAFLLSFPANELVIPVMLMSYLSENTLIDYTSTSALYDILINNGWTLLTAVNTLILCLFHFPCSTTILLIKKETKSLKYTFLSIVIPLIIGISLCMLNTIISKFF